MSLQAKILITCATAALLSDLALGFNPEQPYNDETLRFFSRPDSSDQAEGQHWAVIVAGSNGWFNYRHQADACHAYHVLRNHGVAEERIITLMYDDIANNRENPTPGIIVNHINGSDVYGGVKIDYRQEDVNPEVFLGVLSGNESAVMGIGSGRVLKTGSNDHIFVNFVDHGAPGLVAFPAGELYARDLMRTIKRMYKQRMYKQMVFYIEACESGSMFHHLLPRDINVYATTAANPTESSYACYFDQKRNTYLGDVYSVKWMEDSDKEKLNVETLHKQFEIVKQETNTSHVKQYGDRNISQESVAEFQGSENYVAPSPIIVPSTPFDAVPSEEVRSSILAHKLSQATTDAQKQATMAQIEELVKERERIEMTVRHIVGLTSADTFQVSRILTYRRDLTNFDCYEPVAKHFDKICYDLSKHEFALRNMYRLVNLCEEGVSMETIMDAITKICRSHL